MKIQQNIIVAACLCFEAICGLDAYAQITRYVSLDGGNDASGGYTNWAGAATAIQSAIDACNHGDVIIVSNGEFKAAGAVVVNINKSVDIRSHMGRGLTIIDGEKSRRCVQMESNDEEMRPIYLTGFTIRYGLASSGAGINADSPCAMTVSDCLIISNYTADKGGGVRKTTAYSILTLTNCLIAQNTADVYGGGIYTLTGRIHVFDCDIISNESATAGGIYGGTPSYTGIIMTVCSSTIQYNKATNGTGGGIGSLMSAGGFLLVDRCTIADNQATDRGGGIWTREWPGVTVISNSVIKNNKGGGGGGAGLAGPTIMNNCLVSCNTGSVGGGVYVRTYPVELNNLTIVSNHAYQVSGGGGGGLFVLNNGQCNLLNCIIYDNSSDAGYVVRSNLYIATGVAFTNCCTAPLEGNGTTVLGSGNIDDNPQYVYSEDGHFRLAPESPCVNYGITQPWMRHDLDLIGRSRVDRFSGKVDLGAYEYIPSGMLFNIK
ncbi:MAG: hypothetical protein ACOYCD_09455 [Kiritimatiellia bacterium]|jgi:hypothetical protein